MWLELRSLPQTYLKMILILDAASLPPNWTGMGMGGNQMQSRGSEHRIAQSVHYYWWPIAILSLL